MKKALLIGAGILGFVLIAATGPEKGPTNYWANYVLIPSDTADVGDVPIESNTAYIAIAVGDLSELTEAQAAHNTTTGDVRQITYAILEQYYDVREAQVQTNKLTKQTLTEGTALSDSTTIMVEQMLTTYQTIGSFSTPDE